jgi:hypothetical protein
MSVMCGAREYLLSEWTKRWQSTVDYRQTKVWYPAPDMPKSDQLMKHTRPTVGRTARILSGFAFFRKQSAIIAQSRNPPHRLNTIVVHQMPDDKPEWDMESMLQFLRKEEIILMEDC